MTQAQHFSQFPDPAWNGGYVTICCDSTSQWPMHCTIDWAPKALGGVSWVATAEAPCKAFKIPSGCIGGDATEAEGKSLALALNIT